MKFILLIFGFLFSLSLWSTGAAGQAAPAPQGTTRVITLSECLNLSVANSPRLKIADLEQIRLRYNRKATVGMGLPQVNSSASWDDYLHVPVMMIPNIFSNPPNPGEMIPVQFGTNFNISGAIDASQMLYNQSWLVALRLARQMEHQNDLLTENDRIEVVYEVAQSYRMAQITRQQIRNMQSNLEKIEKAEKIAASQFENGFIKKIDLDRIVVQKSNMITEIERLQVGYLQYMAMQKYYMGLSQDEEISLEDSIATAIVSPVKENSLNSHIDIRLIGMQKELVSTNIRLYQAGYYPNLTLIGSMNYTNQNNTMYFFGKPSDWYNTTLVGLRLSVPIFSGMQKHYQVSQTKIELDKLKVREDDARKLIRINSEDASRKLLNSAEAEKRQRDNMQLAERVYGISQEQYEQGIIPLTDLLSAEMALSDAQSNHIFALVQMKLSELNYLKANGRLLEILK
jgi:outer membrane protein